MQKFIKIEDKCLKSVSEFEKEEKRGFNIEIRSKLIFNVDNS